MPNVSELIHFASLNSKQLNAVGLVLTTGNGSPRAQQLQPGLISVFGRRIQGFWTWTLLLWKGNLVFFLCQDFKDSGYFYE